MSLNPIKGSSYRTKDGTIKTRYSVQMHACIEEFERRWNEYSSKNN
jgi:hypothetical protein